MRKNGKKNLNFTGLCSTFSYCQDISDCSSCESRITNHASNLKHDSTYRYLNKAKKNLHTTEEANSRTIKDMIYNLPVFNPIYNDVETFKRKEENKEIVYMTGVEYNKFLQNTRNSYNNGPHYSTVVTEELQLSNAHDLGNTFPLKIHGNDNLFKKVNLKNRHLIASIKKKYYQQKAEQIYDSNQVVEHAIINTNQAGFVKNHELKNNNLRSDFRTDKRLNQHRNSIDSYSTKNSQNKNKNNDSAQINLTSQIEFKNKEKIIGKDQSRLISNSDNEGSIQRNETQSEFTRRSVSLNHTDINETVDEPMQYHKTDNHTTTMAKSINGVVNESQGEITKSGLHSNVTQNSSNYIKLDNYISSQHDKAKTAFAKNKNVRQFSYELGTNQNKYNVSKSTGSFELAPKISESELVNLMQDSIVHAKHKDKKSQFVTELSRYFETCPVGLKKELIRIKSKAKIVKPLDKYSKFRLLKQIQKRNLLTKKYNGKINWVEELRKTQSENESYYSRIDQICNLNHDEEKISHSTSLPGKYSFHIELHPLDKKNHWNYTTTTKKSITDLDTLPINTTINSKLITSAQKPTKNDITIAQKQNDNIEQVTMIESNKIIDNTIDASENNIYNNNSRLDKSSVSNNKVVSNNLNSNNNISKKEIHTNRVISEQNQNEPANDSFSLGAKEKTQNTMDAKVHSNLESRPDKVLPSKQNDSSSNIIVNLSDKNMGENLDSMSSNIVSHDETKFSKLNQFFSEEKKNSQPFVEENKNKYITKSDANVSISEFMPTLSIKESNTISISTSNQTNNDKVSTAEMPIQNKQVDNNTYNIDSTNVGQSSSTKLITNVDSAKPSSFSVSKKSLETISKPSTTSKEAKALPLAAQTTLKKVDQTIKKTAVKSLQKNIISDVSNIGSTNKSVNMVSSKPGLNTKIGQKNVQTEIIKKNQDTMKITNTPKDSNNTVFEESIKGAETGQNNRHDIITNKKSGLGIIQANSNDNNTINAAGVFANSNQKKDIELEINKQSIFENHTQIEENLNTNKDVTVAKVSPQDSQLVNNIIKDISIEQIELENVTNIVSDQIKHKLSNEREVIKKVPKPSIIGDKIQMKKLTTKHDDNIKSDYDQVKAVSNSEPNIAPSNKSFNSVSSAKLGISQRLETSNSLDNQSSNNLEHASNEYANEKKPKSQLSQSSKTVAIPKINNSIVEPIDISNVVQKKSIIEKSNSISSSIKKEVLQKTPSIQSPKMGLKQIPINGKLISVNNNKINSSKVSEIDADNYEIKKELRSNKIDEPATITEYANDINNTNKTQGNLKKTPNKLVDGASGQSTSKIVNVQSTSEKLFPALKNNTNIKLETPMQHLQKSTENNITTTQKTADNQNMTKNSEKEHGTMLESKSIVKAKQNEVNTDDGLESKNKTINYTIKESDKNLADSNQLIGSVKNNNRTESHHIINQDSKNIAQSLVDETPDQDDTIKIKTNSSIDGKLIANDTIKHEAKPITKTVMKAKILQKIEQYKVNTNIKKNNQLRTDALDQTPATTDKISTRNDSGGIPLTKAKSMGKIVSKMAALYDKTDSDKPEKSASNLISTDNNIILEKKNVINNESNGDTKEMQDNLPVKISPNQSNTDAKSSDSSIIINYGSKKDAKNASLQEKTNINAVLHKKPIIIKSKFQHKINSMMQSSNTNEFHSNYKNNQYDSIEIEESINLSENDSDKTNTKNEHINLTKVSKIDTIEPTKAELTDSNINSIIKPTENIENFEKEPQKNYQSVNADSVIHNDTNHKNDTQGDEIEFDVGTPSDIHNSNTDTKITQDMTDESKLQANNNQVSKKLPIKKIQGIQIFKMQDGKKITNLQK